MTDLELVKNIKTFTYSIMYHKELFFVDIIETGKFQHDAWIYTASMGIKSLMFGNGYDDLESFKNLVEENFIEYANNYMQDYR